MAVTMTRLGYSRSVKVASGSIVIAFWPAGTAVPTLEAFKAGPLSDLGPLFQISWMAYKHVGIELLQDITELDLQVAVAAANAGNAAVTTTWTGIETNLAFDELGQEAKDAAGEFAKNAAETLGSAARSALWFAKYGIYLILGIIALGLIAVIVLASRKAKA